MSNKYPGGLVTLNPPAQNPALGAATNGVWTMDQALNAETNRSWAMYDPYYNNVVLNLHGNGTNGGQNNTFLDSSSNNFTITRNGNTTQGSFTPYSQYGSVYYGSGNYWQVPQSTNWDITGAAFTVECFVFLTGYTGDSNQGVFLIGNYTGGSGGSGWNFGLTYGATPTLGMSYWNGGGGTSFGYTGNPVPLNQWAHLAMTRSGSTIYLYVNGVCVYSGAAPSIGAGDKLTSGAYVQNLSYPSYVYGYISNIRIVKGTALYSGTGSFTVPTSRLTAVTNTVFLGNQSNRFADSSGTAGAFTLSGTPTVQAFQPFLQNLPYESSRLGGSGYFDGSGDYLSVPNSTNLDLGSSDFTIEGWWYPTSNSNQNIIAKWWTGGSQWVLQWRNAGYFRFAWNSSSTADYTTTLPLNAWCHFAIVRSGTNLNFYFNGVKNAATGTIGTLTTTTDVCTIGQFNNSGTEYLSGNLTDVRVTKGGALYTATFTPPTAPLTTTVSSGTVQLLTSMTNAAIFDNAAANDLETVGNAQISTSVKKYGTGSMYFDGTGDQLTVATNPLYKFGTGDFTVECWVYANSFSGSPCIVDSRPSGTAVPWAFYINASGYPYFYDGGSLTSSVAVSATTWTHIAASRSSGTLKIFVNGVQGYSAASTTDMAGSGLQIGGAFSGSYLNGYIDDLRITKGVARYTAAFTPPTSQLQDQ